MPKYLVFEVSEDEYHSCEARNLLDAVKKAHNEEAREEEEEYRYIAVLAAEVSVVIAKPHTQHAFTVES